ncbi:hypothetical protein D3C76_547080 [compost metagenome]
MEIRRVTRLGKILQVTVFPMETLGIFDGHRLIAKGPSSDGEAFVSELVLQLRRQLPDPLQVGLVEERTVRRPA